MDTPLSAADFARLQAGKVNEGRFAGRSYFVRFVKLPADVPERYGDPRFVAGGTAVVEALVVDDRDALFTPCRYAVGEAKALVGLRLHDLREVVSFRGRFADQARTGQRVRALGVVERVVWRDRPKTTRLVVGGRPGDYLLALEDEGASPGAGHRGEPGSVERAVLRAADDGPGCSPRGGEPRS